MSDKFEVLNNMTFERDMNCPFSPESLSILRRNDDEAVVLRLRLVNNSEKLLTEAALSIECLPSGKVIKYTYTDLLAEQDESFGEGISVNTGLADIEKLNISILRARFEDGTVWDSGAEPDNAPEAAQEQSPEAVQEKSSAERSPAEQEQPAAVPAENTKDGSKRLIPVICGVAAAAVIGIAAVSLSGGAETAPAAAGTEAQTDAPVTEPSETEAVTTTAEETTTVSETTQTEPEDDDEPMPEEPDDDGPDVEDDKYQTYTAPDGNFTFTYDQTLLGISDEDGKGVRVFDLNDGGYGSSMIVMYDMRGSEYEDVFNRILDSDDYKFPSSGGVYFYYSDITDGIYSECAVLHNEGFMPCFFVISIDMNRYSVLKEAFEDIVQSTETPEEEAPPQETEHAAETEGDGKQYGYVKEGTVTLNVRSSPTTNSDAVGKIHDNDRFEIISEAADSETGYTWYYIQCTDKDISGYIRGDYAVFE